MLRKILFVVVAVLALPFFAHAATVDRSRVCSLAKSAGLASCSAHFKIGAGGVPQISAQPQGYGPVQLRGAYEVAGKAAGHPIVAIVDAYDDPTIKLDLDAYSRHFGLPVLPACAGPVARSAAACFQKINQRGTTAVPAVNRGWSVEIALDVEAVHAMCENCSILLVEATSPNMKNLLAAEDTAVKSGAAVISNSWGGPEFSAETGYDSHFDHPGVAITVSSGDSGYGVEYPAASPYVTAVGGTSLYLNGDRYQNEDAWSGAGSGCSRYEAKPSWQHDTRCTGRTVADVSAVADPATGFAVYTTTATGGSVGWFTVGGTSLAAPVIGSVYALSGNIPAGSQASSLPYLLGSQSNLHDVVGGSNGSCGSIYLCMGKTHYDGPTGLGSPKGTRAF